MHKTLGNVLNTGLLASKGRINHETLWDRGLRAGGFLGWPCWEGPILRPLLRYCAVIGCTLPLKRECDLEWGSLFAQGVPGKGRSYEPLAGSILGLWGDKCRGPRQGNWVTHHSLCYKNQWEKVSPERFQVCNRKLQHLVSWPCGPTYFLRCGDVDLSLIYWFLLCFFLPFPAGGSNREVRLHKSLGLDLFGIDHHFEV